MRLFPHAPLEAGGVIAEEGMLPDDVSDTVGLAVQQFNSIPSWTGEKRRLREELDALCARQGYAGFEADPRDYAVHRVGQSFLYDVPEGKRGRLAKFCGKRVRIVCLWSGKYRRWVRVGVVEPSHYRTRCGRVSLRNFETITAKKVSALVVLCQVRPDECAAFFK